MATVNYRDPTTQQWAVLDPSVGPAGAPGAAGPAGPTAVSTDPGNAATVNADGIYVPAVTQAETDLLYVQAAGDTMTGALLLPDQVLAPPSAPVAAAAKGYVDQLITASPDEPSGVPARDGLIWNVIEDPNAPSAPIVWTERPVDWLPNPGIAKDDQTIGFLIHVPDGGTASFGLTATTLGFGGFTVDWGDGSAPESVNNNANAMHEYVSGNLPATPLTSDGMRQVWCIATPEAGEVFETVGGAYAGGTTPGIVEMVVGPSIAAFTDFQNSWINSIQHIEFLGTWRPSTCIGAFGSQYALKAVTGDTDTSLVTGFDSMFNDCSVLTTIPRLDVSSGISFDNMFWSCNLLTDIPPLDTGSGTSFFSMFNSCTILTTIPSMDTSSGTNFGNMFYGCRAITTIPSMDTSSGTNFSSMFNDCTSLVTIPLLDTGSGTDFSSMFYGCASLATIPQLDTSSGTNFFSMFSYCGALATVPLLDTSSGTALDSMFSFCEILAAVSALDCRASTGSSGMFMYCSNLASIEAFGFTRSVGVPGCLLDAAALNTFFANLGTASLVQKTLDITGNPGAATCDRTIATAKGWTVTG